MRPLVAALAAVLLVGVSGCSNGDDAGPYGAQSAMLGESLAVLGWNMAVSNLRWEADHVLVDVDGAASEPGAPHARAQDLRWGLYGALGHPLEATGIGSCDLMPAVPLQPLAAPTPDRLTGTVCLGPLKNRSAVRGVYAYSPTDRIAGSTVAYPAAFPIGVTPVDGTDTGLAVSTTGVAAWRADGTPLTPAALGDPAAFTGNGYLRLSLTADAPAGRYRDTSLARGGPLMLVVAPTQPVPGLDPACTATGSSVLILPEASLNAVHVEASVCSHGEINAAVLYATLSVIGTHAAVWTGGG